jgi:hypothetical protein
MAGAMSMAELADEAHRSRKVWMDEYMRVLHHMNAQSAANTILEKALFSVGRKLDMTGADDAMMKTVVDALKAAKAVMVDAVKPRPDPDDPSRTFRFVMERDYDWVMTRKPNGDFADPKVQQAWDMFNLGAKFGFRNAEKKYATVHD